jgi:hypothetical protein
MPSILSSLPSPPAAKVDEFFTELGLTPPSFSSQPAARVGRHVPSTVSGRQGRGRLQLEQLYQGAVLPAQAPRHQGLQPLGMAIGVPTPAINQKAHTPAVRMANEQETAQRFRAYLPQGVQYNPAMSTEEMVNGRNVEGSSKLRSISSPPMPSSSRLARGSPGAPIVGAPGQALRRGASLEKDAARLVSPKGTTTWPPTQQQTVASVLTGVMLPPTPTRVLSSGKKQRHPSFHALQSNLASGGRKSRSGASSPAHMSQQHRMDDLLSSSDSLSNSAFQPLPPPAFESDLKSPVRPSTVPQQVEPQQYIYQQLMSREYLNLLIAPQPLLLSPSRSASSSSSSSSFDDSDFTALWTLPVEIEAETEQEFVEVAGMYFESVAQILHHLSRHPPIQQADKQFKDKLALIRYLKENAGKAVERARKGVQGERKQQSFSSSSSSSSASLLSLLLSPSSSSLFSFAVPTPTSDDLQRCAAAAGVNMEERRTREIVKEIAQHNAAAASSQHMQAYLIPSLPDLFSLVRTVIEASEEEKELKEFINKEKVVGEMVHILHTAPLFPSKLIVSLSSLSLLSSCLGEGGKEKKEVVRILGELARRCEAAQTEKEIEVWRSQDMTELVDKVRQFEKYEKESRMNGAEGNGNASGNGDSKSLAASGSSSIATSTTNLHSSRALPPCAVLSSPASNLTPSDDLLISELMDFLDSIGTNHDLAPLMANSPSFVAQLRRIVPRRGVLIEFFHTLKDQASLLDEIKRDSSEEGIRIAVLERVHALEIKRCMEEQHRVERMQGSPITTSWMGAESEGREARMSNGTEILKEAPLVGKEQGKEEKEARATLSSYDSSSAATESEPLVPSSSSPSHPHPSPASQLSYLEVRNAQQMQFEASTLPPIGRRTVNGSEDTSTAAASESQSSQYKLTNIPPTGSSADFISPSTAAWTAQAAWSNDASSTASRPVPQPDFDSLEVTSISAESSPNPAVSRPLPAAATQSGEENGVQPEAMRETPETVVQPATTSEPASSVPILATPVKAAPIASADGGSSTSDPPSVDSPATSLTSPTAGGGTSASRRGSITITPHRKSSVGSMFSPTAANGAAQAMPNQTTPTKGETALATDATTVASSHAPAMPSAAVASDSTSANVSAKSTDEVPTVPQAIAYYESMTVNGDVEPIQSSTANSSVAAADVTPVPTATSRRTSAAVMGATVVASVPTPLTGSRPASASEAVAAKAAPQGIAVAKDAVEAASAGEDDANPTPADNFATAGDASSAREPAVALATDASSVAGVEASTSSSLHAAAVEAPWTASSPEVITVGGKATESSASASVDVAASGVTDASNGSVESLAVPPADSPVPSTPPPNVRVIITEDPSIRTLNVLRDADRMPSSDRVLSNDRVTSNSSIDSSPMASPQSMLSMASPPSILPSPQSMVSPQSIVSPQFMVSSMSSDAEDPSTPRTPIGDHADSTPIASAIPLGGALDISALIKRATKSKRSSLRAEDAKSPTNALSPISDDPSLASKRKHRSRRSSLRDTSPLPSPSHDTLLTPQKGAGQDSNVTLSPMDGSLSAASSAAPSPQQSPKPSPLSVSPPGPLVLPPLTHDTELVIDCQCENLDSMRVLMKANPYLEIYMCSRADVALSTKKGDVLGNVASMRDKSKGNFYESVYKTETSMKELNPIFRRIIISSHNVCRNEYDRPILFRVWDESRAGDENQCMGEVQVSLRELMQPLYANGQKNLDALKVPLLRPELREKKGYANSGFLIFTSLVRYRKIDRIPGSMNAASHFSPQPDPRRLMTLKKQQTRAGLKTMMGWQKEELKELKGEVEKVEKEEKKEEGKESEKEKDEKKREKKDDKEKDKKDKKRDRDASPMNQPGISGAEQQRRLMSSRQASTERTAEGEKEREKEKEKKEKKEKREKKEKKSKRDKRKSMGGDSAISSAATSGAEDSEVENDGDRDPSTSPTRALAAGSLDTSSSSPVPSKYDHHFLSVIGIVARDLPKPAWYSFGAPNPYFSIYGKKSVIEAWKQRAESGELATLASPASPKDAQRALSDGSASSVSPVNVTSTKETDVWVPMWTSEIKHDTVNPEWDPFVLDVSALSNGDWDSSVQLTISYSSSTEKISKPDVVGSAVLSLRELLTGSADPEDAGAHLAPDASTDNLSLTANSNQKQLALTRSLSKLNRSAMQGDSATAAKELKAIKRRSVLSTKKPSRPDIPVFKVPGGPATGQVIVRSVVLLESMPGLKQPSITADFNAALQSFTALPSAAVPSKCVISPGQDPTRQTSLRRFSTLSGKAGGVVFVGSSATNGGDSGTSSRRTSVDLKDMLKAALNAEAAPATSPTKESGDAALRRTHTSGLNSRRASGQLTQSGLQL